ncbi:hypothetical protein [Actinoplanes sp. CA-252034]|uniref:hypothetical protein n=1 Tax=Actinoplanes sp. CA-252034 TaxID=3239906 RepID=UPI003D964B0A
MTRSIDGVAGTQQHEEDEQVGGVEYGCGEPEPFGVFEGVAGFVEEGGQILQPGVGAADGDLPLAGADFGQSRCASSAVMPRRSSTLMQTLGVESTSVSTAP